MHDVEAICQRARLGPFRRGSIFAKAIASTLTAEQFALYEKIESELVLNRHRSTIVWVLGTWDETLKLSAEQHRRLQALFEEETRPPQTFGTHDYFGLLLQLSRLPEKRLKPFFSLEQWKSLQVQLAEATRLEVELKNDGYVPDDDVARVPGGGGGGPAGKPENKRG